MPLEIDVAIVGGGITGLSAAWFLQQQGREDGRPLRYVLLESSDRWGGKIKTETVRGSGGESFVIEGGPDSFITTKPWAWQLTKQLALQGEALPTNDDRRQVFVLRKGKPVPLPDGVMMIVPTKFAPFVRSPLISPLGKLRMGMDLFIPPRKDGLDETLAEFIRRRLGDEALDRIAEPLMSGIYNAEAEKQSLLATFPRFRDIETEHGSLIRGMLAAKAARAKSPSSNGPDTGEGRPPSAFVSYQDGMEALVDSLLAELHGDLRLETAVLSIKQRADETYDIVTAQESLRARAIILAVPAYIAAGLVQSISPQAAEELNQIRYVSTGTISLAYRRDEIGHPLDGFGIVIPRSEKRRINAVTWTSSKFNRRAPQDHVLLRVFFGGSRSPQMMDKDDEELEQTVRKELSTLMGVSAEPVLRRIYRWRRANPQYDVGHLDRVEHIESLLPQGILLAGSPYRGIGIPDCVHQAQLASESASRLIGEAEVQPAGRLGSELAGSSTNQLSENASPNYPKGASSETQNPKSEIQNTPRAPRPNSQFAELENG